MEKCSLECSLERVLIRKVLLNGEKVLIRVLIREKVLIRVLIREVLLNGEKVLIRVLIREKFIRVLII